MAKADIFQAIEDYRQEVNRNELTTLRQLTRLWVPSYKYLREQVAALMRIIQAKREKGEAVEMEYNKYCGVIRRSTQELKNAG